MNERLRTAVTVIVVLVWALNVLVPIFVKDYEPIPELNSAFMGLAGLIIAGRWNSADRNNEEEPNELEARRAAREEGDRDSTEERP